MAADPRTPQADTPQADTPQADTPQADTPQADTPQADTPQADTPQADTPQADTPKTTGPPNAGQWVEIEFDCLPLRSISRLDVPVDASPKYEQFVLRVKDAMKRHGNHNTYYLHHGTCTYHLTNDPKQGCVEFAFEGTVVTCQQDRKTRLVDINVELASETCPWLSEPVVGFLAESVQHAVLVEFDRYIEAGDLKKTEERIEAMNEESDSGLGFVGMYL